MALTDISIRSAKPKEKAYKLSDAGGLYILVQPNGAKYWRLKYRVSGKEKLLSIGLILRLLYLLPGKELLRLKSSLPII